nr:hypothetical protein OH820_23370 [Streptomyces sp. NBC_00857]
MDQTAQAMPPRRRTSWDKALFTHLVKRTGPTGYPDAEFCR